MQPVDATFHCKSYKWQRTVIYFLITNGVHLFQVQDGLPESVAVVKAQEGDDEPGPEQGKEV